MSKTNNNLEKRIKEQKRQECIDEGHKSEEVLSYNYRGKPEVYCHCNYCGKFYDRFASYEEQKFFLDLLEEPMTI